MCKGEMHEWEPNEDPMLDHQRYFPDCPIVKIRTLSLTREVDTDSSLNLNLAELRSRNVMLKYVSSPYFSSRDNWGPSQYKDVVLPV